MGWTVDRYRADPLALRHFADSGNVFAGSLTSIAERLGLARAAVVSSLDHRVPSGADRALDDLRARVGTTNEFARSIERSLLDRAAIAGPLLLLPSDDVRGRHRRPEAAADRPRPIDHAGNRSRLFDRVLDEAKRQIRRTVEAAVDPIDDLVVDTIPFYAALPELGGRVALGPLYPAMARFLNTNVTPVGVQLLWSKLDRFADSGAGTGDRGGTFTTRSTGLRLAGLQGRPIDRGRAAIIGALSGTADADRLHQDEFELIAHGDDTYTLVLAGVTDLSTPDAGLNPRHHSVRDTDVVAARSAASASVDDNAYARLVIDALDRLGVPAGADLMIVGHSQGADTALDLAADSGFNGERYNVSHVVAAGYHSEPQLDHVAAPTSVLVLQNNKDLPVLLENLGHLAVDPFQEFATPGEHITVREFDGGWRGAGHHPANYVSYLEHGHDDDLTGFFTSVALAGYADTGRAEAIDISHPDATPPGPIIRSVGLPKPASAPEPRPAARDRDPRSASGR